MREFYTFKGGLTEVECHDVDNVCHVTLETQVPGSKFRMRGNADFDDQGLRSFSCEIMTSGGAVIHSGNRDDRGMHVEFHGNGFHGAATFNRASYDITTFDLMVLEEKDIADVEVGDRVRVLDPIDVEIHMATLVTSKQREGGAEVRKLALDFDGEVHELTFDAQSGAVVRGKSAGVEWRATAPALAAHQKRSLGI